MSRCVARKPDLVAEIARLLGIATPPMSTGSTEPREIFSLIDEGLGLRLELDHKLTKPELARGIVEAAGFPWLTDYESRGGTVTREGLAAVLRAVEMFLGTSSAPPPA